MTTIARSLSSQITEITGAEHVITGPAQLAAYEIDGKAPGAAVRPASREEICEIVKFAAAEELSIVPCGARSKLAMGATPRAYDIALDVSRLDRVIAYDPSDLTLSVEPGIPLQRLAGVLAGQRQFLPLAVPFLSLATAGGTVAAGVSSPLRQAYGTARDFLLGAEFVMGTGTIAKSGGTVVKNVAGYDLHKLTIGAMGTLGIITKLNFRTFPSPANTRIFAAASVNAEGALEMRRLLMHSPLRLLALEILSPGAIDMLCSQVATRTEPGLAPVDCMPKKWALFAVYSGTGKAGERYARDLEKFAQQAGCDFVQNLGDDKAPASFGRLREFIPIALASSPGTTVLKIGVLPSKMKEIFAALAEAARANNIRCAAVARGSGELYAALLPVARDEDAARCVSQIVGQVRAACYQMGGHAIVPWCPAEWKRDMNVWGPERPDFEQMRKLKKVFDPAGIFAPGRFAGGI